MPILRTFVPNYTKIHAWQYIQGWEISKISCHDTVYTVVWGKLVVVNIHEKKSW